MSAGFGKVEVRLGTPESLLVHVSFAGPYDHFSVQSQSDTTRRTRLVELLLDALVVLSNPELLTRLRVRLIELLDDEPWCEGLAHFRGVVLSCGCLLLSMPSSR